MPRGPSSAPCWSTRLEYKANWYGREVIAVDRFFPSSELCSHCGSLAEAMPLRVRTWMATAAARPTTGTCSEAENPTARAVGVPLAHEGRKSTGLFSMLLRVHGRRDGLG